jgi:hypothetical protein
VVDRIRIGYEAQLARIDRRLEAMSSGAVDGDGPGDGIGSATDATGYLGAERELRKQVIRAERTELDLLLTRRKISERVADGVREALDVDETTMGP